MLWGNNFKLKKQLELKTWLPQRTRHGPNSLAVGGWCCGGNLPGTAEGTDKSETAADSRASGHRTTHTALPFPSKVHDSYNTVAATTSEEPVCGLEVTLSLQGSI